MGELVVVVVVGAWVGTFLQLEMINTFEKDIDHMSIVNRWVIVMRSLQDDLPSL